MDIKDLYEKATEKLLKQVIANKHTAPGALGILEEARNYLEWAGGNAQTENKLIIEYVEKGATESE